MNQIPTLTLVIVLYLKDGFQISNYIHRFLKSEILFPFFFHQSLHPKSFQKECFCYLFFQDVWHHELFSVCMRILHMYIHTYVPPAQDFQLFSPDS